MKTNNSKRNKFPCQITDFFSSRDSKLINKIARRCGFQKRKFRKIKPLFLIIGFLRMSVKNLSSYEDLAGEISILSGQTVSRQAIQDRMTANTTTMAKLFLEEKMKELADASVLFKVKTIGKFPCIKTEDSTMIALEDNFHEVFPGNTSRGLKKSQAKFHTMFDLTQGSFDFLNLHSYSSSDQKLSMQALDYLKSGDLLLRDLGFQNLAVQQLLCEKGINFISKKKSNIKVFDPQSGDEINLTKHLQKKKTFDGQVLVGTDDKLKLRLIVRPLPKDVANERVRKARKDRDKRQNHSDDYYTLLRYSILITNIDEELCSPKEIMELYRLRWKIEIIFKAWKSHFSIEKLIPKQTINPERIRCVLYLMMLYVILFQKITMRGIWNRLASDEKFLKKSTLKMAKYFKQHFIDLLEGKNTEKILNQLMRYCVYDTRKDRQNAMQIYQKMVA